MILEFALQMQRKMQLNSHKNGWKHLSNKHLLKRLRQEVIELEKILESKDSVAPQDIAYECADIANFAMMIFDNNCESLNEAMYK